MPANEAVTLENVRIVFRNFIGREGKYNKEGQRTFAVVLDEAKALEMLEDDPEWNIKWFKPREEDEEGEPPTAYLPVALEYEKGRPPTVMLITSHKRRSLGEEEVEVLDWANIINVDMIINPYPWNVNGKTGTKAYLRSMYITIEEDYLERKYAEMEEQQR